MKGTTKRLLQKAKNNLNQIRFEGATLSVVLAFLVLIISGNIIRVFTNGQSNYSTFLEEKADLNKLLERNETLAKEYEYVTSDEYKSLLLRDSQNLAKPEEVLFNTKEKPSFFFEEPEYLDVSIKKDYFDWWIKLIER